MTWFKSPYRSMGQKHDSTPILNLSFTKACYGFSESLLCREHRKRIKNTKSWPVLKIQNFPIHFAAYFKGQILKILMKKKNFRTKFWPKSKNSLIEVQGNVIVHSFYETDFFKSIFLVSKFFFSPKKIPASTPILCLVLISYLKRIWVRMVKRCWTRDFLNAKDL